MVQSARTRARRRLVGALVLLVIGVVGFPLLFETQPRPLPVDTPILVPEATPVRAGAAPAGTVRPLPTLPPDAGVESAVAPVEVGGAVAASAALQVSAAQPTPVPAPRSEAASVPATKPSPPPKSTSAPSPTHTPTPTPTPAPTPTPPPTPTPAAKPASPHSPVAVVTPSKAAAEPAPATSPAAGRFVVQVGAYNEIERLKAARAKLDKLGYKSYTQDVDTPTGKRTRVRVGPYNSKQEADAVAVKLKAAGMQTAILSL